MSRANAEIVRRAIEAFNRRDLDAALEDVGEQIEVDWSRSRGVEAGVYRGYEAVRGFWSTFLEVFDPITISPAEFVETGEHVVVPNTTHARGRDGIEVEAQSVAVVRLRGGRIVEWNLYRGRAEALSAVEGSVGHGG